MDTYFLAIDQGTTGATAILFDRSFAPVARGYCEIKQSYPKAGWVEHNPTDIYNAVCGAVAEAMTAAGAAPADILAIGIDHEGESVALWDAET
ncbi:MAG: hypothetical protein IKA46_02920 [Clostridia bacterium]|nr:hypothetical protein [Clostridia bacterium]